MGAEHTLLIEEAAKWLRKKCSVIITDMATSNSETADAIGWQGWASTLIECKASRSDFLADAKKQFRQMPENGMGLYRYYCALRGVIKLEELPEKWGLLEWDGKKLRCLKTAEHFLEYNLRNELALMNSALRRVGAVCPAGVSVKCYTFETKNRATLGVEIEGDDG